MKFRKRTAAGTSLSFQDFVEIGLKSPDVNVVDGMPWSFDFMGIPVTHENDDCYLLPLPDGEVFRFERGNVLCVDIRIL